MEWARSWKAWLRGAAIGFPLGALPAGGAEIPTFVSNRVERRLARDRASSATPAPSKASRDQKAANNAAAAGTLVPLLVRSDCRPRPPRRSCWRHSSSIGLQPGPLLFQHEPRLVWGLIASLYVGNVMLLVLNLPLVGLWVRLLTIPRPVLYGAIPDPGERRRVQRRTALPAFDVGLLLAAIEGAGYLMRCHSIPLARRRSWRDH